MAFDKSTRNALAKMVTACRERLAADISNQLQSTFGLYPDGTRLDVARTEADKRATAELRALLDYFIASDASGAKNLQNAYQRLVREIGFTTLNRLAALRLSEERGLVIESVRRGMDSDGFRLFDRVANGALGTRYATYRAFIEGMYDELALELPALFDRHHPHSRVFPGEIALNEVLELLNDPNLSQREIWRQDETIGWIYQYYNDPAERKKMRNESQAPRNSRELAVRNQFFTPRYVVEFLTDNTLGRIWYEMRGGETVLAEICRYLVKNPSFPQGDELGVRAKKDPRDLKILDPACGSGHFLLYAFDLLLRIYEEAWADANVPRSVETGTFLKDDYPDLESLRHAAPGLILRHNLHGIDIDPRAAQIAALALWLRAQRAYLELRLKPDKRPAIQKTNIVTAEPMPGDPALLEDFLATVEVPFIQKLVRDVFDKMTLAGEAGSLLKIEEEIRDSIAAAKQAWLKRPKTEQMSLWQEEQQLQAEQLVLFEGVTDESFWGQAEQRVLDALQDYARHAENGKGTRRRLFAEDAERGFAFIDLSKSKFDVVLMNPPFGVPSKISKDYIDKSFSNSKNDIFACFITRYLDCLNADGFIGVISSRTGFFLTSFSEWRENVLLNSGEPYLFLDLGGGVLEAMVETAAYCLMPSHTDEAVFMRMFDVGEKDSILDELVYSTNQGILNDRLYRVAPQTFRQIPGSPFAYWASPKTKQFFSTFSKLETSGRSARIGLSTKNDFRFVRLHWEIPPDELNPEKKWSHYANGSKTSPFYWDFAPVVLRKDDFKELRAYLAKKFPYLASNTGWILHDENDYIQPFIGWPLRADRFSPQAVSPNHVFSARTYGLLLEDQGALLSYLAILNSKLVRYLLALKLGKSVQPDYVTAAVRVLPVPSIDKESAEELSSLSKGLFNSAQYRFAHDETSNIFLGLSDYQDLLPDNKLMDQIDSIVCKLYGADDDVKNEMDVFLLEGNSSVEEDENEEADESEADTLKIISKISFMVGCSFGRWDVRVAANNEIVGKLPNPFNELPIVSPATLVGQNGLPATINNIVSEAWLKSRQDVTSLPKAKEKIDNDSGKATRWVMLDGKEYPANISDKDYPLPIPWDGILVDDTGFDGRTLHSSDIIRRMRDVLEVLWPKNHAEIEAEACQILDVKDLRDYFRKPSGFFADHLKRYSKSRRQAPIYWPLSTPSGSYTLWIYYHRLSDEILFTAVNRYVDPKIAQVERSVNAMQTELGQLSGKSATELRDQQDELREFLTELRQFREELLRIANLPYKPDLNDGVILNAAPFHRLFRLSKWAKDTESVWKKLAGGEYDWARIAYAIWPDRVREACKSDKSIAIAHGLESLYEGKEEVKKRKKKSKKVEEEQDEMEME
jgi:hypothetical protein